MKPSGSPLPPTLINSPIGKLANRIPEEIGISNKGSFFLTIPK